MKYLPITFLCWLIFSCQNYESEKYYVEEEIVIIQLLSQFVQLDDMIHLNRYADSVPVLHIISELDNRIEIYQDSTDIIIKDDSSGLIVNRQLSVETIQENRFFKPLTTDVLKRRTIISELKHEKLKILKISAKRLDQIELPTYLEENPHVYGFLHITRIVFNRDFSVGYMGYSFYCGAACGWGENIEIQKKNGRWMITEHFSAIAS